MRSVMRLAAVIALAAAARAQDFAADRAALAAEVVPRLEELAEWCRNEKLFREAIRCWDAILKLQPEHAKARAVLRYTKTKDGWRQDPSFKEPRNLAADNVREAELRRAALVETYAGRVFDAMEAAGDRVDAATRRETLRTLSTLAPDEHRIRKAWLAARAGGPLVREDAPLLVRQLRELEDAAKALVEAVPPPKETALNGFEKDLGFRWTSPLRTDHVRLLGTGPLDELKAALTGAEAAGALYERVFGTPPRYHAQYTIYLLANPDEGSRFLERCTQVDSDARKFAERTRGVWKDYATLADWTENRDRRIEAAVRQTIARLMRDGLGITTTHGWVQEGFGMYLNYQILRTRLLWYAMPSRYANQGISLRERLAQSGTDWFREAKDLIDSSRKPTIVQVLAKDVNALSDEEVLYAYAIAACLIHVRPADVTALLRAIGSGKTAIEAFRETMGLELPQLEALVLQWVKSVAG